MRIAFRYNHLHAEEYLYYRKKELIEELEKCIVDIDANKYLKFSCDKTHLGEIYYDQKALNEEIEKIIKEAAETAKENTSAICSSHTEAQLQAFRKALCNTLVHSHALCAF